MTLEQLRSARDANPFRAFTLHMPGGRALRVRHRDYVSVSPRGRTVIVYGDNEAFSVVDLFLVTELEADPPPPVPDPTSAT